MNSQAAASLATASSGSVEVHSEDALDAYGDGITATSSAVAAANLDQTANQSNTNSASATGTGILQGQLVGQANINANFDREEGLEPGQAGIAAAEATSDHVYVDQSGVLSAGGDGITATSSAVAAATLTQTANQSNTNSATATLEALTPIVIEVPTLLDVDPADLLEGTTAAQEQLVGQLNVNAQGGLAAASATSDYVEVRSEDPAAGDGITATSSAVAAATLTQTADQTNDNSATITLPPLQVIPDDVKRPILFETAEQAELVLQTNVNQQEGAVSADATSGSVTVENGFINVSGDGVTATSSAVAVATLDQTATQANTDTKTIDRAAGATPGEGETTIPVETDVSQDELVDQENFNEQAGAADASATSDSVLVRSEGDLSAGGDGIIATSSAVAVADLSQSVTQDNSNSVAATGTDLGFGLGVEQALIEVDGGQDQSVSQTNLNVGDEEDDPGQEAAAYATATSGSVYVQQDGNLTRGGNGITATSSAVAVAALDQTADQSNSNDLSATPAGPDFVDHTADQEQSVGQENVSVQAGEATADATSDYVEVRSAGDPATGDGINATSSAVATATLNQTADQTNENSSTITLPNVPEGEEVTERLNQSQEVGQENISEQEGSVGATATSNYVSVEQGGALSAGGDGVTATSSAVAVADLNQTAKQHNSNTQEVVRTPPAEGETSVQPITLSGQEQSVEQSNESGQSGGAAAYATSDSVDVNSSNSVSVGGNGITATSSAVAAADLEQSADQSNENEQTTTATGYETSQGFEQANSSEQFGEVTAGAYSDYVKVNKSGSLDAGGDGINATSAAEAQAKLGQSAKQSNDDTVSVALEAPTVESAPVSLVSSDPTNENSQVGELSAEATSDYVEIEQSGPLTAGGTGIAATSSAIAKAELDQTADQSNSAASSVNGPDVDTGKGTVSSTQDQEQANENEQDGSATAGAYSDYVSVDKNGNLSSGAGGIDAESKAVAVAAIDQSADQTNSASHDLAVRSGNIVGTQEVDQANSSDQSGEAIAVAESDYVSVNNYGDVWNSGGDGIHAELHRRCSGQSRAGSQPNKHGKSIWDYNRGSLKCVAEPNCRPIKRQ